MIKKKIQELVREYYKETFASKTFVPGESPVPVSGKVFDAQDMLALVESSLDFWLTAGRFSDQFEADFSKLLGVDHVVPVNSGSSANLLAISSLTSPLLKDRRLRPGDEVISLASGFPTTVNPIIQNQLVPVLVDIEIPTYNVLVEDLERVLTKKSKAVILPHTLGNPFKVDAVRDFCNANHLWLIEDACDALDSKYHGKKAGTFGDLATFSFYPAHHITMGEGGCVVTSDGLLKKILESIRDWGRECWCKTGMDNSCKNRFGMKIGDLPDGYDHKYTYSHIGYNLKLTDMQAAVGVAQLKKLQTFTKTRKKNYKLLNQGVAGLEEFFILPKETGGSDPSWFGYPLAVRNQAPFKRTQLLQYLDAKRIGTRLLFGGNLIRQPAYRNVRYRTSGTLPNSDFVMKNVFWIGVFPGLTQSMIEYMVETICEFVRQN